MAGMVGLVGRVTRHSTEYIENTFFFVLQTRYHKERERVGDHREGETAFSIWGNIASESKRKSEESKNTEHNLARNTALWLLLCTSIMYEIVHDHTNGGMNNKAVRTNRGG